MNNTYCCCDLVEKKDSFSKVQFFKGLTKPAPVIPLLFLNLPGFDRFHCEVVKACWMSQQVAEKQLSFFDAESEVQI